MINLLEIIKIIMLQNNLKNLLLIIISRRFKIKVVMGVLVIVLT
jgi:hypothetical protein